MDRDPVELAAPRRTLAQERGDAAEDAVAVVLHARGWEVIARNVRVGRAEIDILARDPGPPARLVAVEVRLRTGRAFGLPEETFDRAKRGRIRSAIVRLAEAGTLPDGTRLPRAALAVDLVAVEPPAGGSGRLRLRHHRDVG